MTQNQPTPSPRRGPGFFWPIILIGLGLIFLLSNLGWLPSNVWSLLWQLWPVILILIGLDILLGRRSIWGGILGAVLALLIVGGVIALLFIMQTLPNQFEWSAPFVFGEREFQSQRIAHPLGDVRQADVRIDFPGGRGSISVLDDSANLIEGNVSYSGGLVDRYSVSGDRARVELDSRSWGWGISFGWSDPQWTLGLNPRIEYDLNLSTGSGRYDLDLSKLELKSLALDSGSGHVSLSLPAMGQYHFKLHSGSGSVDVRVPEGVAVRVEYDAGSGSLTAPNLHKVSGGRRDGVYESPNFSQTGSFVIVELDGGSGSISLQ